MKKICTILLLILSISCTEKSRYQKIQDYFEEIKIPQSSNIGVLSPDFCGSCTDYSIDCLIKNKSAKLKNVILSIGKMKSNYYSKLKKAGYEFVYTTQTKISRLGIPLAACTLIVLADSEIKKIKTVK